jgi:ribosomal protein S18 acetylase RimI-like enzyme
MTQDTWFKMGNSVELRPEEHEAFAKWIESPKPPAERNAIPDVTAYFASSLPAKVIVKDRAWTCGCFFRSLPGSVATLAGLRFKPGQQQLAVGLLRELVNDHVRAGYRQVQAITPTAHDEDAAWCKQNIAALAEAGFEKVTCIQHRYLTKVSQAEFDLSTGAHELRLRSVGEFTKKRVAKLLGQTFVGTLDCPELGEIRTPDEYLTGFLEGTRLREKKNWYVVVNDREPCGCLLLNAHGQSALEINYFGVIPAARGLRIGEYLIAAAIRLAGHAGMSIIVAAVDEKNRPAIQHYDHFNFQIHKRFDVWLSR